MKDNMNINGIEDYIVEGTNVSELLRNNQKKVQIKKQAKKEERKQTIMTIALITGIMIIFSMVCIIASRYNQKEINKCINAGHSQNYCERNI